MQRVCRYQTLSRLVTKSVPGTSWGRMCPRSPLMDSPETLSLEGLDVAVTETADALTYTFTPQHPGARAHFPAILVLLFIGFPLGLLVLVGYALDVTRGNRPEWERVLTGVFVVQVIVWAVVGLSL